MKTSTILKLRKCNDIYTMANLTTVNNEKSDFRKSLKEAILWCVKNSVDGQEQLLNFDKMLMTSEDTSKISDFSKSTFACIIDCVNFILSKMNSEQSTGYAFIYDCKSFQYKLESYKISEMTKHLNFKIRCPINSTIISVSTDIFGNTQENERKLNYSNISFSDIYDFSHNDKIVNEFSTAYRDLKQATNSEDKDTFKKLDNILKSEILIESLLKSIIVK